MTMKKIVLLTLMTMVMVSAKAQFLYRLDLNKNGQKSQPSYIVASHKMGNPKDVAPQIGQIDAVMKKVKVVAYDFSPVADSMRVVEPSSYLSNSMVLKGQTLKDVLSDAQYSKLNALLKKYAGGDMSDPTISKRYGTMTPHAMAENLDQLIYKSAHPDYNPTDSLNQYFLTMAEKHKLPVVGMWFSFKLAWRWNNMSKEKQMKQIDEILNDDAARLKYLEWSLDGYRSGKLDETTTENASTSCGHKHCKRPGEMVYMFAEQAPTLFILDAGELGGDWGVFRKLRDMGATVTPVE